MGTRYSSISISGFNASPPPDDGSQTASNQLTWAKHVTKIGNPLKTMAEAINAALVTALSTTCRSITSSDSTVASDHWKTVQVASTVTAAITVTLMDATTAANGYIVTIANQSAVSHTIARATASDIISTGTNNITIYPFEALTFVVNAAANGYILIARATLNNTTATSASSAAGTYQWLCFALTSEAGALATTETLFTYRMPAACIPISVRASLNTASTATAVVTFDIKDDTVSIFSTKPTIDANEKTSATAATPAVISSTAIADDSEIIIDCDEAGVGAIGAKIYLLVRWT